ncbi:hypothetical protein AGLY_012888 [Aphis glycines]|uniref:Uncharacterized protein n=1 Tax=Aphis glycines TaxID=307491 RepID=A0A6G0T997_APHGL|nr:hypothetical protein AGLY_012888 [Aphis glycines]
MKKERIKDSVEQILQWHLFCTHFMGNISVRSIHPIGIMPNDATNVLIKKNIKQIDNVVKVRNRFPSLFTKKIVNMPPTIDMHNEKACLLTTVHWASTLAPNVRNTSTRYGPNGTPDNKFEKKKYISSSRKGLSTSGCISCFQELSELFFPFLSSVLNHEIMIGIAMLASTVNLHCLVMA